LLLLQNVNYLQAAQNGYGRYHYHHLPVRHSHMERSIICLHGCIIGKCNQRANYALRISYALETAPLGMTHPPCTTPPPSALFKYALSCYQIVLLCCHTFLLIKLEAITLRGTHNKRSRQVLASHECGPQRAQHHTPLSATKNGLRQSLYGKTRRITFAFIT
jgi:hypothetical protein